VLHHPVYPLRHLRAVAVDDINGFRRENRGVALQHLDTKQGISFDRSMEIYSMYGHSVD
jgi:hypothetical protein